MRINPRSFAGGTFAAEYLLLTAATTLTGAVGVAFAAQEVEAIPVDEHDERLDLVLTERETIDFRS